MVNCLGAWRCLTYAGDLWLFKQENEHVCSCGFSLDVRCMDFRFDFRLIIIGFSLYVRWMFWMFVSLDVRSDFLCMLGEGSLDFRLSLVGCWLDVGWRFVGCSFDVGFSFDCRDLFVWILV